MSWRITLLGQVSATREGVTVSHFESARAVALLARLALFPHRTHPREELVELLWPEVDTEVARTRLRHTLRTLRVALEAGLPTGSVLIADRTSIRINPEAISTDVAEFQRALARKEPAKARALYAGELLPGLWDDWIVEERHRLEALVEALPEQREPAPHAPAPAPTQAAPARALPPYLTAFFGRETEKAELAQLLTRARLVTLIGLGGTGKTRLAVELMPTLAASFPTAFYVALSECVVASQIPGRIRSVLSLPTSEADPLDQLCWHLAEAPALLVLDNLEQLVDSGGAELVELLLARLPLLTVLVTSRRALGISGERLFPLEPLPEAASVDLFLDRVQATRPGFHLTDGNRDDIHAVCQGLEGIPLALELAAARIRAFSPSEMRRELQTRFEWLARTGLKGDKDDRHRSLAAALEWSWRLLSPTQQQFLASLALFRAPFSASEAAAVTNSSDARERLEALAADSLIVSAAEDDGETRHELRVTVREFVGPRLRDALAARERFRTYYLAHPTRDENRITAWEYALEDSDGEHAYAFAAYQDVDWMALLGTERAQDFLERTRALPCSNPRQGMLTASRLAQCLLRLNDRQGAITLMDQAAAALESAPTELLAETLSYQAYIGLYDAPLEKTLALLERCLSLSHDSYLRAETLRMKGGVICWTPEFERAEALLDEAEALYTPDDPSQDRLLTQRGHLARRRKQFDEALRLFQRGAERALVRGDNLLYKNCQSNLTDILVCLGRWEEALVTGLASLEIEEAYGDRHSLVTVVWTLARPFYEVGDPERAARLMSAAATHWVREVRPLTEEDTEDIAGLRRDLGGVLDEATLARCWSEGEQLTLKEALALARKPRVV